MTTLSSPLKTLATAPINSDAEPIFEPIFGKIVIKIDDTPERKYGQLILPQREKERASIGNVYAVYAPTETSDGIVESQLKVGDTVIFGQYTGTTVTVGRQLFVICKEHDLLTVIRFPDSVAQPEVEEVI